MTVDSWIKPQLIRIKTVKDRKCYFCEKNSLDIESIPKLISKPLKERLKAEAMELNLLKKTSHAKLPI